MSKQYISASKVAQFLYCPFTFELAAAGYEPKEPYVPVVASGTAFHAAFNYMWMGLPAEEAAEAAIAATEIATGAEMSSEEKLSVINRLRSVPSWLLSAKDVEVKIEVDIDDVVIVGFLDAITEDRVVELKAVSRQKNELPPTYMIQAQIYMYATKLDQTTFVMIDPKGNLKTFDVYALKRQTVEEMIKYFAMSMQQQYKPPSGLTNFACNKCSFAYVCPFVQTLKQTKHA